MDTLSPDGRIVDVSSVRLLSNAVDSVVTVVVDMLLITVVVVARVVVVPRVPEARNRQMFL